MKALDVATGGGHVARRLREAGLRGRHARPVARDAGRTSCCRAEHLPFDDGAFDVVVTRIAPHHFEDIRAAVAEMERVSNRLVVVEDTLYSSERHEEAEKLRDPTHVRNYTEDEWRELLDRGRPRGRAGRVLREGASARGLARAHRLRGRGGRAGARAAGRPHDRRRERLDRHEDRHPRAKVARADGDHRRPRHEARRPGRDRPRGLLPHAAQPRRTARASSPGVTPGKGGTDLEGIPIFDTVAEAVDETGANTTHDLRARRASRRTRSTRPSTPGSGP